jgi:hypothetical protein
MNVCLDARSGVSDVTKVAARGEKRVRVDKLSKPRSTMRYDPEIPFKLDCLIVRKLDLPSYRFAF